MGMMKEFKEFAIRGNVVDLAVAIIIGTAFGRIVSSLVEDVIMPPVGLLLGGVNFEDLVITLKEASGTTAAVTINSGRFIQTVVDFTIIAFVIFLLVRMIIRLRKPAAAPEPPKTEVLLTEIRDLLKPGRERVL